MAKKRKSEEPTGKEVKKAKEEKHEDKEEPSGEEKAKPTVGLKVDNDLKVVGLDALLQKIDQLDQKFDKKFKEMDEKFETKFDNLEEKIDHLRKDVRLLVSVSPDIAIQRINPVIVGSKESNRMAVLEGGESTWSYLRSDKSLSAVGSVHCGLYYFSTHSTLTFVNLPKELINLGVLEIGFYEPVGIDNPILHEYDIMIVKLKQSHIPGNESPIHEYKQFDSDQIIQKVAGKSNSGVVSGQNVVANDGHLVFVEDFGEVGNSGTLMFGWSNDVDEAKPVGVYFGVRSIGWGTKSTSNGLHPRGIVVPLPDPQKITWFQVLKDGFPEKLQIFDKRGIRKCNIMREEGSDPAACFLKDGKNWPGVIVDFQEEDKKISYCGSLDTGSRRCV
jgi:hypothetical protein